MNLKTTIVTGTAALAFLTFASGSLLGQVINTVTLTTTIQLQTNPNNNGTTTTLAAPIKYSFDTKQILSALAKAENLEGNYGSSTFPVGAKLVTVVTAIRNTFDFQVLDKNNNLLVDVSDVLIGLSTGVNGSDVFSGKYIDSNVLADPKLTDAEIFTVTYNDTAIPGSDDIVLSLSGLMTNTVTDGVPNATTKIYSESQTHTLTAAAGDGSADFDPGVGTATFSASGKGSLTAP